MGDGEKASLRLQFNPKVRLAFHGATITTDAQIPHLTLLGAVCVLSGGVRVSTRGDA